MPKEMRKSYKITVLSICVAVVYQFGCCQVIGSDCGTVSRAVPLVVGGNQIQRGAWPYLAAVYEVSESRYSCGGTLISSKHVLTAAHCIQGKFTTKKLSPEDIKVHLGAYNLTEISESTVVQRNVKEIHIHPDWNLYNDEYDADVAILLLSESVNFTNYIRPVCMPADDDIVDGVRGYVVGWGLDEYGIGPHKEFPKEALTYALNASYCYTTNQAIAAFSSPRTFCGGGGRGSPNEGDSGGGFFVLSHFTWVQYGIVSAIHQNKNGHVDPNAFAIYQNVKLFKNWIVATTRETGGVVKTVGEGTTTKLAKGEIPFLAKLYFVKTRQFICSGTLISSTHVLTAAHCIQEKYYDNRVFSPDDFLVHLEAFNHTLNSDNSVLRSIGHLRRNVSQIHLHPDWDLYSSSYDADVAILLLSSSVYDNKYIRPVCMPADDVFIDGVRGTVVLWNLLEEKTKSNKEFPRPIVVTAYNDSYCFRTYQHIVTSSSDRTFCGRSETEPLNKDDGGSGLFVHSGSTWVHYGMVSEISLGARGRDDVNPMTIYQNIKLFKDWIIEIVGLSGDAVVMTMCEAAAVEIHLDCKYIDNQPYACMLHDLEIIHGKPTVASVTGVHLTGKTTESVEEIRFCDGKMIYLPDKIGIYFKNLKYFSVRSKLGLKILRRSNFKNMVDLVDLEIGSNEIEILNEETLWDLPNLKRFFLYDNEVKLLHEGTFEKNLKLKQIILRSNKLEFLPRYLFKNNFLLDSVNFDDNLLKNIETGFSNIKIISLLHNVCINAIYYETEYFESYRNVIKNLTQFQDVLCAKCSFNKP